MDKLPTVDQNTIKSVVNMAVSMVGKWTHHELVKLVNQKTSSKEKPIIIPIGKHGYIIGNYAIKKQKDCYSMMYRYSDKELEFNSLSNAMNYSICQHRRQSKIADDILNLDNQIAKLQHKEKFYIYKIQHSKDTFKRDYFSNRLTQIKSNLYTAKLRLEKTLNQAKYTNHRD